MKFFIFGIVFIAAELVHFAQSSALKKPATVEKPASLGPYPQNRYCSVKFGFDKTYYGNCIYPGVSPEQCKDGLSLRGSCGKGYNNGGRMKLSFPASGRISCPYFLEIFCCVRIKCNAHLDGDCQDRYKNCPGTWALWVSQDSIRSSVSKALMFVRRGALSYWPGEGLEPIPNECPFLGYPAECCVRDPLPGLQGPRISSIKTDAICPLVDGRFDPLTVFFAIFDKSPETDFHHQPVLPIKAARAVWIWWMRLYHGYHPMAHNRMMSAETPLWFHRYLVPMVLPSIKKGIDLRSWKVYRQEISCWLRENPYHQHGIKSQFRAIRFWMRTKGLLSGAHRQLGANSQPKEIDHRREPNFWIQSLHH